MKEPEIIAQHREQLAYLLTEAAEIVDASLTATAGRLVGIEPKATMARK